MQKTDNEERPSQPKLDLGKLLGLENKMCVLTGVTTSGYYVRTAQSPAITDLAGMLRAWPEKNLP